MKLSLCGSSFGTISLFRYDEIWGIEIIFCKYVIILNILIISKPLKILQKKTKNKLIKQIIVYILRLFYCF